MKRSLAFVILVAAATAGWMLLPSNEACAQMVCGPGGQTLAWWGMGATCDAAIQDAIDTAMADIPGNCDVCRTTPVEVSPCGACIDNPGTPQDDCPPGIDYKADYKVVYRCYTEFEDPPM